MNKEAINSKASAHAFALQLTPHRDHVASSIPVTFPHSNGKTSLTEEEKRALTSQVAYLNAERRGFAPGHELDDWLAAEREIAAHFGTEDEQRSDAR